MKDVVIWEKAGASVQTDPEYRCDKSDHKEWVSAPSSPSKEESLAGRDEEALWVDFDFPARALRA